MQRYRFRGAVERKHRYRELRGPIDWLEAAKLVRKCHPIKNRPRVPPRAQARQNIFKLYLFDSSSTVSTEVQKPISSKIMNL